MTRSWDAATYDRLPLPHVAWGEGVLDRLGLSGDEWEHERPRERQTEKKPSIKERLEQSRKECANQSKAQPHREKSAPEL